jgi:TonB family protein
MPIFGSLLMSTVIATTPATPLPWFDLNDYPTKAFEREWQGTTNFDVIVDPQGRSTDCRIAKSSGHEILDRSACWVAMKRARFTPAIGADGQRAFGVYRTQVVWSRPDRTGIQRDLGPDLEVSVNQLPAGTPEAVKLAYFVDVVGNPSACTPLPDSAKQPKQLVDLACQALFQQLPRQAVTANGAAVAAVRTAAVKVVAQK